MNNKELLVPPSSNTQAVYPTAALGYRVFTLRADGLLGSLYADDYWRPGVNTAVCCAQFFCPWDEEAQDHNQQQVPAQNCACGLQAFHTLEQANRYSWNLHSSDKEVANSDYVLALVAGAGRLQVHERGWRAQFAQILGLRLAGPVWWGLDPRKHERTLRQQLRERYRVPVTFRLNSLTKMADKLAVQAVPTELIPGAAPLEGPQPHHTGLSFSESVIDNLAKHSLRKIR